MDSNNPYDMNGAIEAKAKVPIKNAWDFRDIKLLR